MWIKWVNDTSATYVTMVLGTMWCVYVFLIWSLLPFLVPTSQEIVFYVSSGILQLMSLPLIIVSLNVLHRQREARAARDHAAVMAMLAEIKTVQAALKDEDIELYDIDLSDITQRLTRIEKAIKPPRKARKSTSSRLA